MRVRARAASSSAPGRHGVIIRAGQESLKKNPNPDADGFVACEADQQRERKYELRAEIERGNRQASSVDLIFADPPYNIGKDFHGQKDRWPSDREYLEWCHVWIDLCVQKLKGSGSFYLMASTQCMPFLDIYLRSRLTVLSRIVWFYDSSGVQAKRYFGSPLYRQPIHSGSESGRKVNENVMCASPAHLLTCRES